MSGAFAFLGSGEFEAWHDDVDRWLLERAGGQGRVLIAPTASAPEGEGVFGSWADKGLAHYARLDVPAEVLPLRTRDDAERPELVAALDGASMIFFSGGNPWYLASTLTGTSFWGRLCERLQDGLAYGGCSAGVACLTERTFDSDTDDFDQVFRAGLGHARGVLFGPHWDMIDQWVPGARGFITASMPPGEVLVGLDERTAMMGDGSAWSVAGAGAVHLYRDGRWTTHGAGASFELPVIPLEPDAAVI